MYYYWIPIFILFLAAIFSGNGNRTWSPFQSSQVKDICEHMSNSERKAAMKKSALFGILIGIVPVVTSLILGITIFRSALNSLIACGVIFPILAAILWKKWYPYTVKSQQRFLASTEWARSQNINADEIKLYKWN
jgi:hypothetical protein